MLVLFTSLQNIVIFVNNSHSIYICAGVKTTKVVCPHNGTYDLCIFAILSKTGFVDIEPLCCKPSTCIVFVCLYALLSVSVYVLVCPNVCVEYLCISVSSDWIRQPRSHKVSILLFLIILIVMPLSVETLCCLRVCLSVRSSVTKL